MKNIFYASECGAKLNSNIVTGGDDDTAAIQKILNRAPELGSLHLIIDGVALVTGLTVYSNTTSNGVQGATSGIKKQVV